MKHVLVTGGAGYIGSHTVLALLEEGYTVTVIDNLVNSSFESIKRVEKLTGKKIQFYELDLVNEAGLNVIFTKNKFDSVIHFAGHKAVGESVAQPLKYYRNNIDSTLVLCQTMDKHDVRRLVFSSSATVYGMPKKVPITEDAATSPTNPYGNTKLMIEQILQDLALSDKKWHINILRYFNPIGAHNSGLIGEDPNGKPNNLMPYISQVAVGKYKRVEIYGNDYSTIDGTGVRDYIHVSDLASGHLAALEHTPEPFETSIYNLGSGVGTSVLEAITAFEAASGVTIPYHFSNRRNGDIAICLADASKALRELGWKTERNTFEACQDAWRWQSQNPNGYGIK